VKRSRDQSAEAPSRRSWWVIVPPDCVFHSQTLDELLAAEPLLVDLRLRELVGDDDLGGDAGVIGPWLPQHVATAHPLIADQHVLQRKGQCVTHMQAPRHVRGRHHDRVGQLASVGVGRKPAGALPPGISACLYGGGLISLVQHC